jgi:exosortase
VNGRRAWRPLDAALLVAITALAVGATWGIWRDVFGIATHNEEQSHILLAIPIAAWLLWVRRERFRLLRPRYSLAGPAAIALGWAMAWAGFRTGVDVARHLGALTVVCGGALTILGLGFVRGFLPAILALLFLLPIPLRIRHEIALPLQQVTAAATQHLLEIFAVPVQRMGNVLLVNEHEVAVAEACNGMRMVAALGLVAFAFVFSVPMRQGVRVTILLLSPLLAVLVNVIRLVPTVLLYGYASDSTAETFHDLSGWVMLFVALGLLWAVLGLLRWVEIPIAPYAVGEQ